MHHLLRHFVPLSCGRFFILASVQKKHAILYMLLLTVNVNDVVFVGKLMACDLDAKTDAQMEK